MSEHRVEVIGFIRQRRSRMFKLSRLTVRSVGGESALRCSVEESKSDLKNRRVETVG